MANCGIAQDEINAKCKEKKIVTIGHSLSMEAVYKTEHHVLPDKCLLTSSVRLEKVNNEPCLRPELRDV